jgi:hypothetical protein
LKVAFPIVGFFGDPGKLPSEIRYLADKVLSLSALHVERVLPLASKGLSYGKLGL